MTCYENDCGPIPKQYENLDELKNIRYEEIDIKTATLILQGFEYDSTQFSLSKMAQLNWQVLKNNTSSFTWPMDISTKNNYKYSLLENNVGSFWNAAKNKVKQHLDSGRALKVQIYDASTQEEVDAIVDNR